MGYTKQSWADLDPTKVLSAARMSHIEDGIGTANTQEATGMLASQNGINYDGTDEGGKLNTLLTSAATFGVTVLLDAGKTLSASTAITPPSGTRLNLNGATIKVLAAAGASTRIITIVGVSDVTIFGGIIDGDKASYAPVTEQRHNICITNSTRVSVRNLRTLRAKGDGIYVGDNLSGFSTDITIENVRSDSNHRQGMSVSHVDGMEVINSWFTNTTGTAPMAGVDIEPNDPTIVCQNIKFIACRFNGNAGAGVQVTLPASPTARMAGFDFIGCTFTSNTADGLMLAAATDVRVFGGEITLNGGMGVREMNARSAISHSIKLDSVEIGNNQTHGIAITYGIDGLTVNGCSVHDNGQATAATYTGINISPSVASANIRIIGNNSGGAQQKYGLVTSANASSVTIVGNVWPSNATAAMTLSDSVASRILLDAAGVSATGPLTLRAVGGTSLIALWGTSDITLPRTTLRNDGSMHFGDGTVLDVGLSRTAANVLAQDAGNVLKTGQNVTGSRPAASTVGKGAQFYDTTLNLPIWSDGTNWKNAAGTTV